MSDILAMQRAIWRSARATTEKIVLLAIIDYYSEASQQPWPSVPTLSKRTSLGKTAVLEAIAALDRDGVLVVRREHGRANRYDLSRVCIALAPVRQADPPRMRTAVSAPAETACVSEACEPIREADSFVTRTSAPGEQDQSALRTEPVRLADPKDPKKEPIKEARVRAGAGELLKEVLATPVAERARRALASARAAQRLRPQEWPEVLKIRDAFAQAVGRERPLGELARDSGLRAIVALLAAGNDVGEVEWVAGNVPKQSWWRSEGKTRGLATLSQEVVARALEERDARAAVGSVRDAQR